MVTTPVPARPRLLRRLAPVLGLLVLSPVCAEYLSGYDGNAGRPLVLLGGLLFLAPLYGAVAVLIREAARRTGRGWPTVLLLALAMGVVQSGLVDQSLFNPAYRDIAYWDDMRASTLVPGTGVSAELALTFLFGHMVWSFAAPIALVEALAPRDLARRPWLGWFGTSVLAVLYAAAALLVLDDHLDTEGFVAAPGQLVGAAAVAAALVVAAFALPRRAAGGVSVPGDTARVRGNRGRAPSPWAVGAAVLAAMTVNVFLPQTWPGVAAEAALLAALAVLLFTASRREGWSGRHVVLVAGAPLLVTAAFSFATTPLGDPVSPLAKYGSNGFFTLLVVALVAWGHHRARVAA
ncbi:hypothetical protein [Nocardiopsis aegyptia]|uniref:Uncharacterized protein n=1 Tax=Nocardiopsis aegyptia TaxID=220378 RepID=A0A7Z0JAG7_9ACTN|nr:hypothetical protein [Nocardiopsis aegyptia]NYJ35116.1 hypothetical protein [Nocardiopsis aegyptia]